LRPGQGNNSYIFPGVGLGMIACRARTIPDTVFMEAAQALAGAVTESDLELGSIYPQINEIRGVSLKIATAVADYAYKNDLTDQDRPGDLAGYIEALMYDPMY
jgi:malate dehydrogenase (oxaloacetate-decarboxylating)(NADP+)